ncbi:hypothetical protein EDEG_01919 [Edhazardia aedis USNM 41457]|uniref:Septin-type G domain-containing protein n=1 Tax=Edhazardia aedis (strain USNM 41457) TaxID=1003232 RepID=J9DMG4_EDHAE|nr:hypothetical protein EDEG_01919 [Edhazardia aedis USNM 41457]|eukprot:EJW03790.1 hypothetical protein EDEG_01919 [Edhazardia aedis USNM 41457]
MNGFGLNLLKEQNHRFQMKNGHNYNIMIVGKRGVGKTSFINNLFGIKFLPYSPFDTSEQDNLTEIMFLLPYAPYEVIQKSSEITPEYYKNCLLNFQVTKGKFKSCNYNINVTVTEVDGVGDALNNEKCCEPIVKYIGDSFENYEKQKINNTVIVKNDKRIHICIFMFEANTIPLKATDYHILRTLAPHCTVIPVIVLNCAYQENSIHKIYQMINEDFLKNEIKIGEVVRFEHSSDHNEMFPFFLVSKRLRKLKSWATPLTEEKLSFSKKILKEELSRLRQVFLGKKIFDFIDFTNYHQKIYENRSLMKKIITQPDSFSEERNIIEEFFFEIRAIEKKKLYEKSVLVSKKMELERLLAELYKNYN